MSSMFAILAWVTWVWVFPSRSDGSSVWLTNFLIYSSGPKNGSSEILSTISQKNPQIGFRGIYQEFWEGKGGCMGEVCPVLRLEGSQGP